ncbi:MAG TPA: sialidase family protein [Candidatus Saccharimonadales bacterium]|nr:sialidase family protein [Candidatus Saccharimonadales bacterium]
MTKVINTKNITLLTTLILVLSIGGGSIAPYSESVNAYVCRDIIDAPISASGENVYVTWANNKTGDWEVLFRASNDSGNSFGEKINLSNSPGINSFDPDIASDDKNVYVTFHDARSGSVDTYVRTSTDGGKTFGPLISINGTGTLEQKPEIRPPNFDPVEDAMENTIIAASDNNVYVSSWDKKTGNWEVFLSASNDNGQTFGETINLSNSSDAKSDRAILEAEGNNVYVSWWETTAPGKQDPVLRVSNDNGQTFGPVLDLGANSTIGETEETTRSPTQ